MERNNKELFVITGGAPNGDKRDFGGYGKTRGGSRHSAPRQLSKNVNLVNQKAIQWLQARAEEVLAQVDDSLFTMAEKAHQQDEQDRLFGAIRAIRVEHSNLLDGFCDGIEERFHSPRNDNPGEDAELNSSGTLKSLSLLNNDDLEQQVAIRTMVANVRRDHAESIAALSLRLDTLLPSKIYDENMPLGPAAICAAFADALEDVEISLRARMTVFKKFELQLVNRLGELYEACNRLLIEQGVLPTIDDPLRRQSRQQARPQRRPPMPPGAVADAGMQALGQLPAGPQGTEGMAPTGLSAAGMAPGASGYAAPGYPEMGYGGAVDGGAGTGNGSYAPGLMPFGSGAAPMATPTLLQHLGQFQMALPVQSGATGHLVNVTELLQQHLIASKQSASLQELDSEVIRLVDMLFSFMLEDRNLAEPIKVQLIRLQLPMLKLAVADKAFFSKGGHPARRLLNELADAAIGWQPGEDYRNDPLYREISAIVDGVLAEYDQDEQIFLRLLESFREFSQRERKRAAVMERRTIDEAQGTARVEAAKARVAAVFEALTAERKLPKIVHEWLNRVWSSVLFRTCLKEGTDSGSWRQHVLTARDLIWSVVAPMPESSAKMRQLLPDLKKRLQDGAQSLSLSGADCQRLLGGLEALYRERQKLGERVESERERRIRERLVQELRREADSVLSIPVADEVMSAPPLQEVVGAADVVLDEARELPPTQKALPEVEEIQQVVTQASAVKPVDLKALPQSDDHWQQTYHLKDSWFLLRQPEKLPMRCRLAAIISDLDQFMFVNRQGAKVGVYSRLELAHALRDEELLPLEQGPLFERALQHVVGSCGESKLAISV
ncbi:DUF1631 domain-containing protein [Microbulbifer pacificus]|uniref:DUF1631 domain-containing protein n=1 Tax=Microbulbifer pacificus TaxID=407164 RepID=A0AAU0N1K9_9GAMM|nr:DUF1631 domain-containing protein [Microbulbifer pacificus]WOX06153.1 DUF1631 domain-containing protein [Microbulbifer pacificus]